MKKVPASQEAALLCPKIRSNPIRPLRWLTALMLLVFSFGCKKESEDTGTTGICPIVESTDPINGAINVPTFQVIKATFNEAMDPATINGTTFLVKQGSNAVAGTVSYAGLVASFTPTNPLTANTVYTATITSAVRDPAGNAMVADYVWNFNTGAVPIVVSTDPANGASDVALNRVVTALFSTAMDPATINSTSVVLRQGTTVVPGVVTYSGSTATFTPAAPFTANTVYTGTITTAAKDVAGNAMAANYTWSFATGAPPTVIATVPANGATGVPVSIVLTAEFSKVMNAATINATTFTLKQGATAITGTVTYAGTTATFTPTAPLTGATLYTATITTGAKDVAGNPLGANYVWTFTTAVPLDNTRPTVISTIPLNNATGVPVDQLISATFSELMNAATISTNTFQLRQGANPISGVVTYAGTTATFNPTVNLAPNTTYVATITTGAQDLAGNALANNYMWTFTTIGV
ncbi:MAG: hypothetical protein EOO15_09920, partial [Chitinophagaceae bacterium]